MALPLTSYILAASAAFRTPPTFGRTLRAIEFPEAVPASGLAPSGRAVERAHSTGSFGEGLRNNCVEACDQNRDQIENFDRLMTDVRAKDRPKITFTPKDVVKLEITAKDSASAELEDGPPGMEMG